jgi:hypothetical protein
MGWFEVPLPERVAGADLPEDRAGLPRSSLRTRLSSAGRAKAGERCGAGLREGLFPPTLPAVLLPVFPTGLAGLPLEAVLE